MQVKHSPTLLHSCLKAEQDVSEHWAIDWRAWPEERVKAADIEAVDVVAIHIGEHGDLRCHLDHIDVLVDDEGKHWISERQEQEYFS